METKADVHDELISKQITYMGRPYHLKITSLREMSMKYQAGQTQYQIGESYELEAKNRSSLNTS